MPTPETIIAAAPNTLYLHFQFVPTTKASDHYVKEHTLKRSVVAWKLEGGRPMPIVLGLPIEIDPETFEGVTAIAVPGVGLVDPLTGQLWGRTNCLSATARRFGKIGSPKIIQHRRPSRPRRLKKRSKVPSSRCHAWGDRSPKKSAWKF